jgi:hypothetical protein
MANKVVGIKSFVALAALCGVLGFPSSATAGKNFAARCEGINGNVMALAIQPTYSHQQICACARTNQKLRKQLGSEGIKCTDTLTNFNQVARTPDTPGTPETPPGPGPKGNNGWGNGAEGINNGSDEGNFAQADSKFNESGPKGQR